MLRLPQVATKPSRAKPSKAGTAHGARGLWQALRILGAARCPARLQRCGRRGSTTCPQVKPECGTCRAARPSRDGSGPCSTQSFRNLSGFRGHPRHSRVVGPAGVGRMTADRAARQVEARAGRGTGDLRPASSASPQGTHGPV